MASQNVRAACRDPFSGPLLLDNAVTCPWVGLNTSVGLNAVLLDLDHDLALDLREDLVAMGAPIPDLVIDPWSGRAHAVMRLTAPVRTTEDARPKPQGTADYAGRLLAAAWRATLLPQASLVKSPWGCVSALTGQRLLRGQRPSVLPRWEAYQANQAAGSDLMWITVPGTGPAELGDIIGALAPAFEHDAVGPKLKVAFRKKRGIPDGRGRNCELFDLTRWWAYDHAETSTEVILDHAQSINSGGIFATPLPASEVRALARSIGRFMRTKYQPRKMDADDKRGRDALLGADLDKAGRQALAGKRSATARSQATDAKIAAAVAALQATGRPLTQAAIAAEAGVGINTVARRWSLDPNPPFAALSGNAASCAALPPEGALPGKPIPCSPSLSSLAKRDLEIRRFLALLEVLTLAATKPGSEPPLLPLVPYALRREPKVQAALAKARHAVSDAHRRQDARAARAVAGARRLEMENRLRADPWAAKAWWRAHIADLCAEWDAREAEASGPAELERIRVTRDAVLSGRWRSWRAAERAVRGLPPPPRIDEAELLEAVPW